MSGCQRLCRICFCSHGRLCGSTLTTGVGVLGGILLPLSLLHAWRAEKKEIEEQASTQVLGGLTRQQQPQRQAAQVRLKAQCGATPPQAVQTF